MRAAVIGLWNQCLRAGYLLTDRLFDQNVLGDPFGQPEGNVVALEGGHIVGWALYRVLKQLPTELARYVGRASIGAFCVHPHHRKRGIGSMLYAQGETFARSQGATKLSVVHYPYHLVAGVPNESPELKAFLTRHGFEGWREAYDVHRQLTDPTLGAQLAEGRRKLSGGVHIRPAVKGDERGIIDFVGREFPDGWYYDTKRFFAQGGAPSDVLIALDDDAVIGFAHTHTLDSIELRGSIHWVAQRPGRWGGLGPIGIAAARRRRGFGLALLSAGVEHLRAHGVEELVIDWTDLVDFYGRLGFRIWKRYWQGSKPLRSEGIGS